MSDKFNTSKSNNPCQICGDTTGKCRHIPDTDKYLCMNNIGGNNGHNPDFVWVGDSSDGLWGVFVHHSKYKQKREDSYSQSQQENKKKTSTRRKNKTASISDRHYWYSELAKLLPLEDDHKQDLLRRGVTEEFINSHPFFTLPSGRTSLKGIPNNLPGCSVGGNGMWSGDRGYFIPSYTSSGEISGGQIRVQGDSNKYRYLKNPNLDTGENPLTHIGDMSNTDTLGLVEGYLKPLIAHYKHNLPFIGVPGGLFNSCKEQIKLLLTSYPNIKKLLIYPDAGDLINPHVRRRWEKQVRELEAIAIDIEIKLCWWGQKSKEDFGDIDEIEPDILAKASHVYIDEWLALVDKKLSDEDIKDSGSEGLFTQERAANLVSWYWNGKYSYQTELTQWRFWNGKYWETVHDDEIGHLIIKYLESVDKLYNTPSFIEGVRKLLSMKLGVFRWKVADRNKFVNFSNGVLDIETLNLLPHKPEYRFTSVLPFPYSTITSHDGDLMTQLKNHCPIFFNTFYPAMGACDRKLTKLLAVMNGVLTYKFHNLQMFPYFVGVPASGKGTFVRLLEKMVGRDNHQSTRIAKLNDDYHVATVIDKQLVVCSDEDKQKGNYANLKSMTGGDSVSFRSIYKPPSCSPFYGTILVVANNDIFAGTTSGIERRICNLEFKHAVESSKRDLLLDDKLEKEIPKLVPIVLSMGGDVVRNYLRGINDGAISDFSLANWSNRMSSDSVAGWLDEYVIFEQGCFVPLGGKGGNNNYLYNNYLEWAKASGYQSCNLQSFSGRLLEHAKFLGYTVEKTRGKNGMRINGLRLREEIDSNYPTPSEIIAQTHNQSTSQEGVYHDNNGCRPQKEGYTPPSNHDSVKVSGTSNEPRVYTTDIEGVYVGVDLKPLPDKAGVGGVDQTSIKNTRANSSFGKSKNEKQQSELFDDKYRFTGDEWYWDDKDSGYEPDVWLDVNGEIVKVKVHNQKGMVVKVCVLETEKFLKDVPVESLRQQR